MQTHSEILEQLEAELGLSVFERDMEHAKLREWMVAKYGEEAVCRYERSVKDGDGLKLIRLERDKYA